ncbi:MAG: deoxyribose-phosphate aldolase [Pseudomonadota bacterium]
MDTQQAARLALSCLDLTSLNDADTEADVIKLCARAHGAHGTTAAVCVWPRFAALARRELPAGIAVAAVANFPDGPFDIERAVRDTREIVDAGAQEVDVVLPFVRLIQGDERAVAELLAAVRTACDGLALKVILETGVLASDALIARASQLSLDAGADFLKTSSGKTPVSATREAATVMLNAIGADPRHARVGFKASGGIRTVADACVYFDLVEQILGASALSPQRLRIGASSLLNDIEAVLGGKSSPALAAPGTY